MSYVCHSDIECQSDIEQAVEIYYLYGKATIANIKPTATVTDVSAKKTGVKAAKVN